MVAVTSRAKLMTLIDLVPARVAGCMSRRNFATRALRPIVNRLAPTSPVGVTVRSGPARGIRLVIYARNEKYYWTGTHEREVQRCITDILKPGMVFWDVGAHIGFFSLTASRIVGVSGEVHSFEPMPANRERLLRAIQLNEAENVIVHDVALAAESGTSLLHAHHSTTMWTLVAELGESHGVVVTCWTLDDMAESCDRTPNVIKVDAEGAEVGVLRGGTHLLSSAGPSLIVEFSDGDSLASGRRLLPDRRFDRLSPRHWLIS